MPTVYLSPSTQEYNPYVNAGNEEYWMNRLADAMEPILDASGIRYDRNTPDMTAASSIAASNAGRYDLHLALHSNASGQGSAGNRGVIAFYYPGSVWGQKAAGILAEGNAYIRRVREVNDLIPDTEEMSNRLYRLESIMHKIFEQVKKQPEQAPSLRRFMDYYLPTIEKLLNGYLDLDKQDSDSETIKKTKIEIEGAIDMVNDAFEKLLDSFFQDQAWDLSSDISVMKTMLTQDGLVE